MVRWWIIAIGVVAGCRARFENVHGDAALDAPGTPVPIVYVQGKPKFSTPPIASESVTLGSPVNEHDTLLVAMFINNTVTTVTGVTDTINDTFTLSAAIDDGGHRYYFAVAADTHSGTNIVTVHFDAPPGASFELLVDEYSGIALTSPLDASTYGYGNYSGDPTMVSAPITIEQPGELVYGYATGNCTSVGSGFTLRSAVNGDLTEDAIRGPGTAQTAAMQGCPSSGARWQMFISTFRPQLVP